MISIFLLLFLFLLLLKVEQKKTDNTFDFDFLLLLFALATYCALKARVDRERKGVRTHAREHADKAAKRLRLEERHCAAHHAHVHQQAPQNCREAESGAKVEIARVNDARVRRVVRHERRAVGQVVRSLGRAVRRQASIERDRTWKSAISSR